jgi:hypothetical protein
MRVLASEQAVDYAEIMSSVGHMELKSSNPERLSVPGSLDRIEMELTMSGGKPESGV